MTKTEAINKMIQTAKAEVGYLEKRSNSNLDNKTANAGDSNYTKYWRDIMPSYQGQPWCAAFVSWVLMQAFGKDKANKMLKHWPYVYVPTLASLFANYANPQVGDIVMFKHGGVFTHTGIVTGVNGDYFTTVEGNTSGGSTIIANGGGVCSKGYYNSNLPGTKFARLDWSIVAGQASSGTSTAADIPISMGANGLTITGNNLNVRREPNGQIIGELNKGDRIGCDKRRWVGSTCWFHYADGWVSGDYLDGWICEAGKWWYITAGYKYPKSAWKQIGGAWYYFDANGWMMTGWIQDNKKWYYLKSSGAMAADELVRAGGKVYYVDKSGKMCYTDSSGALK